MTCAKEAVTVTVIHQPTCAAPRWLPAASGKKAEKGGVELGGLGGKLIPTLEKRHHSSSAQLTDSTNVFEYTKETERGVAGC